MTSSAAKSRMERIMRLQEEIDQIKADIRDIYAEEKADGGDKTAMGAAIAIIRKRDKDRTAFDEREAMVDVYLNAFNGSSHTYAYAREGNEYAIAKSAATSSQAKASEDNGSTDNDRYEVVTAATGDASRPSVGGGTDEADRDAGSMPTCALTPRDDLTVGTNSPSAVHPTAENTGAVVSSSAAAPVPNSPDPQFPQVDDGQPEPSSNDAGVKSDVQGVVGQGGCKPVRHSGQFEHQPADLPWIGNEPEVGKAASVTNSPAHGPCEGIARKTPKTEPALDALAGDLGSTPCKGQNTTPPANHSDDAPVNERCLNQGSCKYARHPHKITCSDCGSAFIKKRAEAMA